MPCHGSSGQGLEARPEHPRPNLQRGKNEEDVRNNGLDYRVLPVLPDHPVILSVRTMLELLGKQVDQEVDIDFNEVYQRMTLDAIGESSLELAKQCGSQ